MRLIIIAAILCLCSPTFAQSNANQVFYGESTVYGYTDIIMDGDDLQSVVYWANPETATPGAPACVWSRKINGEWQQVAWAANEYGAAIKHFESMGKAGPLSMMRNHIDLISEHVVIPKDAEPTKPRDWSHGVFKDDPMHALMSGLGNEGARSLSEVLAQSGYPTNPDAIPLSFAADEKYFEFHIKQMQQNGSTNPLLAEEVWLKAYEEEKARGLHKLNTDESIYLVVTIDGKPHKLVPILDQPIKWHIVSESFEEAIKQIENEDIEKMERYKKAIEKIGQYGPVGQEDYQPQDNKRGLKGKNKKNIKCFTYLCSAWRHTENHGQRMTSVRFPNRCMMLCEGSRTVTQTNVCTGKVRVKDVSYSQGQQVALRRGETCDQALQRFTCNMPKCPASHN